MYCRSGQFSSMFNSIEWGRGYTEGNAWHHSFPPYALSAASVASSHGALMMMMTMMIAVMMAMMEMIDDNRWWHRMYRGVVWMLNS